MREKDGQGLELCDSQDSNRLMEFLMAENSAVDNNDRLRRSSQVSSKTTKTKHMDDGDDKVIHKKTDLDIHK